MAKIPAPQQAGIFIESPQAPFRKGTILIFFLALFDRRFSGRKGGWGDSIQANLTPTDLRHFQMIMEKTPISIFSSVNAKKPPSSVRFMDGRGAE
jgi:hypothetical protein